MYLEAYKFQLANHLRGHVRATGDNTKAEEIITKLNQIQVHHNWMIGFYHKLLPFK